jgi:hypothetical protein
LSVATAFYHLMTELSGAAVFCRVPFERLVKQWFTDFSLGL